MKTKITLILVTLFSLSLFSQNPSGELKRWHKISLSFNGPNTSETANPNPFSDYRVDVTFTHPASNTTYNVPGFYTGCDNPEESSCDSGNKWKVNFAPDQKGDWNWSVSFKTGSDVAINGGGSSGGFMDGDTGSFTIDESNKSGRDFRAPNKGRLQYVGEHYLRHSGTDSNNPNGDWFVKAGADAPENTLAYEDFDNTPNRGNRRKNWTPHQQDYNANEASSYTWKNGKGTELLGVVNYLSSKGVNAFSFLTLSLHGDDENVFPHLLKVPVATYNGYNDGQQWNQGVHKDRFDISKMAQWERIFEYADKKGLYMHFKTMETENDNIMDNNNFGKQRKLYYRELIARFGHHLALNWNLTEETTLTNEVAKSTINYIQEVDPYDHNVVIHTYPGEQDQRYNPLLGNNSGLTGASIQTGIGNVHRDVKRWIDKSRDAGKKWVVANDEQGSAQIGVHKDPIDIKKVRDKVLWGTLMAGGAGVEYYYGYDTDITDLNAQDHRSRDVKYTQAGHALNFFNSYLLESLPNMVSSDGLTGNNNDYVLAEPNKVYAVYLQNGGNTNINLPAGTWQVQWYNPRTGGNLSASTVITNSISAPNNEDWVALIKGEATDDPNDDPDCNSTTSEAAPSNDAYLQGTTLFNNAELRTESGNRVTYLKFTAPSTTETITATKLKLTVSTDGGNGTIEIYKGSSNNWNETNLSNTNKPSENGLLGSLNTNYGVGQTYEWPLTGITQGETISLIVKQTGGNDVSFSSKEGSNAPKLVLEYGDCDDCTTSVTMNAITDFPNFTINGFAAGYIDNNRNAMAIDASQYKDEFAAARGSFSGDDGVYNITMTSLKELDGESSYKLKINGTLVGQFQNPTTTVDYDPHTFTFDNVTVADGDTIQVEFDSNSNGTIPEGNGFAYSRGRWTKLKFDCTDGNDDPPTDDDCPALEINGVAAIEAEHFHSMELTDVRKWYVTNQSTNNNPTPDPDPNHFNGASFGGYLEILPDTRVTANDPLTEGVNFTNVAGKMTIVNYKVKFQTTGKYFVWVRAYSTGGEDNGIHVGIDGQWPNSGKRMQWCEGKNQWKWASKQRTDANHCGEQQKIFLNVTTPGIHTISISMREDGFEMDKIVLNKIYNKPNGTGPDEQLENCNLSTSSYELNNEIKLFPNPAYNSVTIKGAEGKANIYDLYGRKILSEININDSNNTINVSTLPSGMYLLVFDDNRVAKFLKQ